MDYRWRLSDDGKIVLCENGERFCEVMAKFQSPSKLSYSSLEASYNFKNIKVEIPKDIISTVKDSRDRFISIRIIETFNDSGDQTSTKWMLSVFDNSKLYKDVVNSAIKCEEDVSKPFDSEMELLKIFRLLKLAGFS